MIEGPGHIPMHLVKMNVEKQNASCATRPRSTCSGRW